MCRKISMEYLVYSKTDYSFDVYDLKSELESKFAIKRDIYLKSVNLSTNKYLTERNLAWVFCKYDIHINRYPKYGEKIKVEKELKSVAIFYLQDSSLEKVKNIQKYRELISKIKIKLLIF